MSVDFERAFKVCERCGKIFIIYNSSTFDNTNVLCIECLANKECKTQKEGISDDYYVTI